MDRLIDADALKLADFQDFSNADVFTAIDAAPTVDAVPVVRCKDCIYATPFLDGSDVLYCVNSYGLRSYVADDDYCCEGESIYDEQ